MLGELNLAELAWEAGGGGSGAPPPREWLETALSGAPAAAAAYDYFIIRVREGGALQISSLVYLFVTGVCQGSFLKFFRNTRTNADQGGFPLPPSDLFSSM